MKQTWLLTTWCSAALVLGLSGAVALAVDNIDPSDDGSQYAWGENTGWLNAEPGGDGGPGVLVEDDGLSGYLWSENTRWVSLSCLNNSTCGTRDYRVTNDGTGSLAGYAWSENAGWISFSCANDGSCGTKNYGVTINPTTGEFSGRAWSENLGWIAFQSAGAVAFGMTTSWRGAATVPEAAEDKVMESIDEVDALDSAVFKKKKQKPFRSKLNEALAKIDQGDFQGAFNKLTNDVLGKTDGCALSGAPDKSDWIRDCASQALVYPLVLEALDLVVLLI